MPSTRTAGATRFRLCRSQLHRENTCDSVQQFLPKVRVNLPLGTANNSLAFEAPYYLPRSPLKTEVLSHEPIHFLLERTRNSTAQRQKLPLETAAGGHCPPWVNLTLLGRGSPILVMSNILNLLRFLLKQTGGPTPQGASVYAVGCGFQ